MQTTYWNGKKTKQSELLSNLMVNIGYTENKVYNAYIAATKIYYDMYNNGGFNLEEASHAGETYLDRLVEIILKADIGEKFGNIKLTNKSDTILQYLEVEDTENCHPELELFLDDIINEVSNHSLNFKVYTVWTKRDEKLLSLSEQPGEGWRSTTFGEAEEYEDWIRNRKEVFHYEVV